LLLETLFWKAKSTVISNLFSVNPYSILLTFVLVSSSSYFFFFVSSSSLSESAKSSSFFESAKSSSFSESTKSSSSSSLASFYKNFSIGFIVCIHFSELRLILEVNFVLCYIDKICSPLTQVNSVPKIGL